MGGEMIFTHNNKEIKDPLTYKALLDSIEKNCKSSQIPVIHNPLRTWRVNEIIWCDLKCYLDELGIDKNYAFGIDLGISRMPPGFHYYILFPKDPNLFKIISNLHTRGLYSVQEYNSKDWLHPWLIKFITTFPGVFRLYYSDGIFGYSNFSTCFCNGSEVSHSPLNKLCCK